MPQSLLTIARRITALSRTGDQASGLGLRIVGEAIMADAKATGPGRGVPVLSGALRSTGRVSGPTVVSGRQTVHLSFGGPAAPYALRQHEDLTLHHRLGEARYLVRAVERFQAEGFEAANRALAQQMAFAIQRARGGG